MPFDRLNIRDLLRASPICWASLLSSSEVLPAAASNAIATATSKSLEVALKVALRTMQRTPRAGSQLLHKALATASGAGGGAFGLATLPIELPISTIIMLRSIADIARSEGEDLAARKAFE